MEETQVPLFKYTYTVEYHDEVVQMAMPQYYEIYSTKSWPAVFVELEAKHGERRVKPVKSDLVGTFY